MASVDAAKDGGEQTPRVIRTSSFVIIEHTRAFVRAHLSGVERNELGPAPVDRHF